MAATAVETAGGSSARSRALSIYSFKHMAGRHSNKSSVPCLHTKDGSHCPVRGLKQAQLITLP